jgi:ATP-dependent helicase/DNAse subunit B
MAIKDTIKEYSNLITICRRILIEEKCDKDEYQRVSGNLQVYTICLEVLKELQKIQQIQKSQSTEKSENNICLWSMKEDKGKPNCVHSDYYLLKYGKYCPLCGGKIIITEKQK